MPRWWRRKRRQEKADSPKGAASRTGESRPKGKAPGQEASPGKPPPAEPAAKPAHGKREPVADLKAREDADPAANAKPGDDAEPATSPEPPRPLEPVPPPGHDAPPPHDPPPAAARAAEATTESEEPAGDDAGVSSLADKVQAVLIAAETTAARIRREAEADAAQIVEERERQRRAARELVHLERLADALSVQAESVKRQCGVLRGLLPAAGDGGGGPAPAPDGTIPEAGEPEVRVRDLRGEREEAGGAGDSSEDGRRFPRISRERVEAYRMKLAGACRADVQAYLMAAGVSEAAEITAELFDPLVPARPAE